MLSDNGVTRQRLESFDRPIKTAPQFFPDKKVQWMPWGVVGAGVCREIRSCLRSDQPLTTPLRSRQTNDHDLFRRRSQDALIREFRNYLGILKAVHSGADLQASAGAVGNCLPQSARGYLGYVTSHIGDSQILPFIEAAVEARTEIASSLTGNKDLLYLDLALESNVRQAAERGAGTAGFGAAALMGPLLQNLCLSLGDNEEACFCLKAWQGLPGTVRAGGRPSREEALQAVAVVNRVRRLLATISDSIVERMSPFANTLGQAAGCDPWAVEIFAEEVVRVSLQGSGSASASRALFPRPVLNPVPTCILTVGPSQPPTLRRVAPPSPSACSSAAWSQLSGAQPSWARGRSSRPARSPGAWWSSPTCPGCRTTSTRTRPFWSSTPSPVRRCS